MGNLLFARQPFNYIKDNIPLTILLSLSEKTYRRMIQDKMAMSPKRENVSKSDSGEFNHDTDWGGKIFFPWQLKNTLVQCEICHGILDLIHFSYPVGFIAWFLFGVYVSWVSLCLFPICQWPGGFWYWHSSCGGENEQCDYN